MRSITFVVTPPASRPPYRLFAETPGLSRERIYNINLLEDGTMVLLGRIRGNPDRARRLIEERVDVLGLSISGESDDGGLVYIHTKPPSEIKRFLEIPREHEVFFDFPVKGTGDGELRVVMIGETNEVLQEALGDVPPEIGVTIERIGPYPERAGDITAVLTDRQREVLDVALELGYYDVPRRATHGDIAAQMGITTGTVTEHLQKVESRVFDAFVD